MLLYSSLYLSGYGLTLDDLKNFRQLGSPTAGHPEYGDAAGIEATTGPLGQGLSMSVGLALAEAMLAARFNRGDHQLIDHHTYVIASDGDIQEGVGAEASSLAGHLGLGKLIVFYDNNHIQLAGKTSMSFSEDVGSATRPTAGTCRTWGRTSPSRTSSGQREAKGVADRPSLVIVRSHIGYGSPTSGLLLVARLAARRGRGEAHQGGLSLAGRQDLYVPTGCASRSRGGRARRGARLRVGAATGRIPLRRARRRGRARADHGRQAARRL